MGAWKPVAQFEQGLSGGQNYHGACRCERLTTGEHVPDRFSESTRELDASNSGAAMFAGERIRLPPTLSRTSRNLCVGPTSCSIRPSDGTRVIIWLK